MSVFGVQAGAGGSIVDPNNPNYGAAVSPPSQSQDGKTSAVATLQENLDSRTGFIRPQAGDAGGRVVISDSDKLTQILVEMRLVSFLLMEMAAGRTIGDELEALRSDVGDPALLNTLS